MHDVFLHTFQGRIQYFFRRGCTTKEWRNWLVTGRRIPVILENRRSSRGGGGRGGRTPCTLPLDPLLHSLQDFYFCCTCSPILHCSLSYTERWKDPEYSDILGSDAFFNWDNTDNIVLRFFDVSINLIFLKKEAIKDSGLFSNWKDWLTLNMFLLIYSFIYLFITVL